MNSPEPDSRLTYKTVGDISLSFDIFSPGRRAGAAPHPCIVFFHGGGWKGGDATQFHPQCRYFASRGMVALSAGYRLGDVHGTTPFECVADGKSAIRWIRRNAAELTVDPSRIAAGGGSAGAHVATAAATLAGFDQENEDLSVSSRPTALVLFNPVFDNGPGGYGHDRVKEWRQNHGKVRLLRFHRRVRREERRGPALLQRCLSAARSAPVGARHGAEGSAGPTG